MKLLPVLLLLAVSCCGPTEVAPAAVTQALDAGAPNAGPLLRGPIDIPPELRKGHPICGDCSGLP